MAAASSSWRAARRASRSKNRSMWASACAATTRTCSKKQYFRMWRRSPRCRPRPTRARPLRSTEIGRVRCRGSVVCGRRGVCVRRGPARKSSIFECGGEVRGAALARRGRHLGLLLHIRKYCFLEPFYVGIGVCSHDADLLEKAVFSNVEEKSEVPPASGEGAATTLY